MTDPLGVTERAPQRRTVRAGDIELVAWEWSGEGDPILLVHATGFHARCWRAVVHDLPGRHVFALDMPSHGGSGRKAPPYDWTHFGDDVAAAVVGLGLQRVLGVGHSMGGHAVVLAAARLPQRFCGLMLVDPVIVDAEVSDRLTAGMTAAAHPIARRRKRWDSPQQMVEALRGRGNFALWDPEVLKDYCEYGLVPCEDGKGFELACPPELEAEVYVGMHMRDIYAAIPKIAVPVDIIRARSRRPDDSRFDFAPSPTWEGLAGCFENARDEQLADRSHFFPMEIPHWMAQRIAAFADSLRLPRDR